MSFRNWHACHDLNTLYILRLSPFPATALDNAVAPALRPTRRRQPPARYLFPRVCPTQKLNRVRQSVVALGNSLRRLTLELSPEVSTKRTLTGGPLQRQSGPENGFVSESRTTRPRRCHFSFAN